MAPSLRAMPIAACNAPPPAAAATGDMTTTVVPGPRWQH